MMRRDLRIQRQKERKEQRAIRAQKKRDLFLLKEQKRDEVYNRKRDLHMLRAKRRQDAADRRREIRQLKAAQAMGRRHIARERSLKRAKRRLARAKRRAARRRRKIWILKRRKEKAHEIWERLDRRQEQMEKRIKERFNA
jgi:hypothetical protein